MDFFPLSLTATANLARNQAVAGVPGHRALLPQALANSPASSAQSS